MTVDTLSDQKLAEIARGCEGVQGGPWKLDKFAAYVWAPSEKGSDFPLMDEPGEHGRVIELRGWGYYTGSGDGALGLSSDDAEARQRLTGKHVARLDPSTVLSLVTELQSSRATIDGLRGERDEARAANERDRSIIIDARNKIHDAIQRWSWLMSGGRGSYAWDDDRFRDEFKAAIDEIGKPLDVLEKLGIDWTNCPSDDASIRAARIDWKARAEAAEASLTTARADGIEEAAKAGWNACRRSIYAVCEDVGTEGEKNRSDTENAPRHHFGRGQMTAAKSIARGFNAMEAADDDNFIAAIRALP